MENERLQERKGQEGLSHTSPHIKLEEREVQLFTFKSDGYITSGKECAAPYLPAFWCWESLCVTDWDQSLLLHRHPRYVCWASWGVQSLTHEHSHRSLEECIRWQGRRTVWKRLKPHSSCACGLLQRVRLHISADFLAAAPCCRPAEAQGDGSHYSHSTCQEQGSVCTTGGYENQFSKCSNVLELRTWSWTGQRCLMLSYIW